VHVKVQGGGSGTSNCSADETNKSLIAQTDPIQETLSFDSRASGSCAYERSCSYFKITVKGNSGGREFDSSANIFYGQQFSAAEGYSASCESQYLVRMRCGTNPLRLEAIPVR
jgi:hypothetical protein